MSKQREYSRADKRKVGYNIPVDPVGTVSDLCPAFSHRVITPQNQLRAKQAPNLQSVSDTNQRLDMISYNGTKLIKWAKIR